MSKSLDLSTNDSASKAMQYEFYKKNSTTVSKCSKVLGSEECDSPNLEYSGPKQAAKTKRTSELISP